MQAMGGDEVSFAALANLPEIIAALKTRNMTDVMDLYRGFIAEMQRYVRAGDFLPCVFSLLWFTVVLRLAFVSHAGFGLVPAPIHALWYDHAASFVHGCSGC